MRLLITLVALGITSAFASANNLDAYLKLRSKQHIVQPTSSASLDSLLGTKIVEVQGVVQGSFKTGNLVSLIFKCGDAQTITVECSEAPPEWLNNGEVPSRLLLRVSRNAEYDPLSAQLIACAPEGELKKVDGVYWKKEAAKTSAASVKHRLASGASRGAPDMHGWIGRPPRGHRDVLLAENQVTPIYANFVKRRNPRLTSEQAMEIARAVIGYSLKYGVEPRLVMAVLTVESDFNPASTSRVGAMGLGQLMPGTAAGLGVRNGYDTTDNLYGTIRLLSSNLELYRTQTNDETKATMLALAAYNAGTGAVKRHGGIPPFPETQHYVTKVMDIYSRLCGG